jgi:hypothetical protein
MNKQLTRITNLVQVSLILIGIGAIAVVYAAMNRTTLEFTSGWGTVAVVLGALLVPLVWADWRTEDRRGKAELTIVMLIGVSVASVVYYSAGVLLKDFWLWARNLPSDTTARLVGSRAIIALGILGVGSLLFWLRLRVRAIYGATEVVVAIVIALAQTRQQPLSSFAANPELGLALLTASVYLVVRGLDNIHQGLYKTPVDRVALGFIRLLRRMSGKSLESMSN